MGLLVGPGKLFRASVFQPGPAGGMYDFEIDNAGFATMPSEITARVGTGWAV